MKINKSSGSLTKTPSDFQERFKDKMSNIGRKGPADAILKRQASLKPIQKENILPPLFQDSTIVLFSSEKHNNLGHHIGSSVGPHMKPQSISYAHMPKKQHGVRSYHDPLAT
jgi:hypothetical protein